MQATTIWLLAADITLFAHLLFVAFVVFGLVLIFVGAARHWHWVYGLRFRALHLLAIVVVAAQAWLGMVCPLTTLEMYFRKRAGDVTYAGTFVSHWMERVLYYDAPAWVFALVYTLFAALVIVSWIRIRPRQRSKI